MDVEGATLSLRITQDGVAEAERGYARVATAGDAAASKVAQAFKAQTTAAQQFVVTQEQSAAAMQRANGIMSDYHAQIRALRDEWVATQAAAQAQTVAITANAEAITASAVAHEKAAASAGAHGLQLGRLRQELGTIVGRITGTNTALDRLGGALGAMAVGSPVIIGVLAGIAAIGFAWEHMKSDAEKTADAVKKSMKDVHDEIMKAQLGMGDLQQAAAQSAVDKAQKAFDAANSANRGPGGTISGGAGANDAKKALDKAQADLLYWQQQKTQIDNEIRVESSKSYAEQLALLITSNKATSDERARALALYKSNEAEIDRLGKSQTDNVRRAQLIGQDATLASALFPKQKVQIESEVVARTELSTALDKQLDEMRKVAAQDAVSFAAAEKDALLVGKQGEARALLANQQDALFARRQAESTLAGPALAQRLADIDALEKQQAATISQEEAVKNAAERQKALNDVVKLAATIGLANAAAIQAQNDAAVKATAAAKKYADEMHSIWRSGFEKITTDGFKSFHDFFEDVLQMFSRLMDRMQKAGKDSGLGFKGLADASSAIAGGLTGYQIGSQTGNTGKGLLGGAAGGALVGSEIGGPVGAVIGGLAGAVGGLFGAAEAHKKAAAALEKAADQVKLSLLQMNAQAGTGTSLAANIEQVRQQSNALADAIDAALPGLKNQVEREKELAQVRRDQAIITAALIEAEKNQSASNIQDYNQRALVGGGAGGSLEQQNDIALRNLELQQARELAAAINRHASSEELAALTLAQSIEKQAEVNRENDAIAARDRDAANAAIQAKLDEAAADRQATIDILNDQLKTANDLLTVNRAQLQSQQQAVNATKQVVDSLKQFSQSLLTGNLSTLSPIDQLNEAKRQRDALFQQAKGGDQTAAGQYGSAAQNYLQLAQQYFASSPGYASAFRDTQSQTQQLTEQFGTQLDIQQQILATLQASNDKLTQQIAVLQKQLDIASGTRADDLIGKINATTDSNEVTRLITELQSMGYMTGRNAPQGADGNYYPSGGYFIASHPGADAWTPQYGTQGGGYSYNDSSGQYESGASTTSANSTSTMVQAGSNAITGKLDLVLAALDVNATVTRRGFADLTAAVRP